MNLLIQIDENTRQRGSILFLIALHQVSLIVLRDPWNAIGVTRPRSPLSSGIRATLNDDLLNKAFTQT